MNTQTQTQTQTQPVSSNRQQRIKYGFKMAFPEKPFTVRLLTSTGAHPKYITAYSRVRKALSSGELVVAGKVTPKEARRGAREMLYQRANAAAAVVTVTAAV